MRTMWEVSRDEAIQSAVNRGMVTLQGDETASLLDVRTTSMQAPGSVNDPTFMSQMATLVAQVAEKSKELVPSASDQAVNASATAKVVAALQNSALVKTQKPPAAGASQMVVASGLSDGTKKLLVVGAAAVLTVGLLKFFTSRRGA